MTIEKMLARLLPYMVIIIVTFSDPDNHELIQNLVMWLLGNSKSFQLKEDLVRCRLTPRELVTLVVKVENIRSTRNTSRQPPTEPVP